MDPGGGEPVHLLDAVMDLVQPPQSRDGVEGAMGEVEAEIGEQQHLDRLQPERLARDRVAKRGGHDERRSSERIASTARTSPIRIDDAVDEDVDEIVRPAVAQQLLALALGEQPLERNEDERRHQEEAEIEQLGEEATDSQKTKGSSR